MKIRSRREIRAVRSLKSAQVAEILGVSVWSVSQLARRGGIEAFRPLGGRGSWRFTEKAVSDFLESRERAQHDELRRRIIRTARPVSEQRRKR